MRVALFRAAADGRRTAARLAELGHEAVLAPVIRIVPTGAAVPPGTAGGLIFTSAHAPEALAIRPDHLRDVQDHPCWCVGPRTAAAAQAAGFTRIKMGEGDAASLARAIMAENGGLRLTLVAARDRKPDLEQALKRAGVALTVIEAYEAEAVQGWPPEMVESLAGVTAALHYSRRSAERAARLAEASGLASRFRAWAHHCLSPDVAAALDHTGIAKLTVAERPEEVALLALLGR